MKEQVIAKVKELVEAPTANDAVKLAAGNYLDMVGTAAEKDAAQALLTALDENVNSIDESLTVFKSPLGKQIFGDAVEGYITQFEAGKAAGETYCMCPACQIGKELYAMRDEIL